MARLVPFLILCAVPATAFAHPHDTPTPDTPPNVIIKKMIKKGDDTLMEKDGKKVIMRRLVIDKDNNDQHAKWSEDEGDDALWGDKEDKRAMAKDDDKKDHIVGLKPSSRLVDLGDGMVAKIDGEDVMILVDGAPLGTDPRRDENITVEKEIKIKNGRKKTRIVIELDTPTQ